MPSIFELIGYLVVIIIATKLTFFIWYLFRCYLLTKIGFKCNLKEFGEWAVITGATDGIGKEYARQLAAKGIDIVLISRTEAKLKDVALEIEKDFDVKTRIITFDFTNSSGYEVIESELENLDIGILVNNVGMTYGVFSEFHKSDMHRMFSVLRCNIFSDVRMSNIVLKGMVQRNQGVVIHVASGLIYVDGPFMNVYGPSKIFMKKFVTSLQLEYSDRIHHQLIIPMYVETKLSKKKPGLMVPTAKKYVESALGTIGIADVTCGYWTHEFLCLVLSLCPMFIIDFVYQKIRTEKMKDG